jgi:hypothetical protein
MTSAPRASSQRASATVVADAHHAAPGRFDASQQSRLRQPEMETHDLGLDLFHYCPKGVVEGQNLRLTYRERGMSRLQELLRSSSGTDRIM